MQVLLIIYSALAVIAVAAQIVLYNDKARNGIYILNMLIGLLLAYIVYTSLPENFEMQKNIALGIASMSIIGLILKSINRNFAYISKILLSISIVGGFIQLFW